MRQKWYVSVLIALCLGLTWGAGAAFSIEPAQFRALGLEQFPQPIALPDVTLRDVEEAQVPLRSFQGKVVLMNFWTTW